MLELNNDYKGQKIAYLKFLNNILYFEDDKRTINYLLQITLNQTLNDVYKSDDRILRDEYKEYIKKAMDIINYTFSYQFTESGYNLLSELVKNYLADLKSNSDSLIFTESLITNIFSENTLRLQLISNLLKYHFEAHGVIAEIAYDCKLKELSEAEAALNAVLELLSNHEYQEELLEENVIEFNKRYRYIHCIVKK